MLKFSLVFSSALLVVFVVAVSVLYAVLAGMGVFDSLNDVLINITKPSGEESASEVSAFISYGRVLTATTVLGLVNVVLISALATLGAFLYNLCADLIGGIEVTLSERE